MSNQKYRNTINELYKKYSNLKGVDDTNEIMRMYSLELMQSELSYLKLFLDNERVRDDYLKVNQDELISGRASKLFLLSEVYKFTDIEEGKRLLTQKLLKEEHEERLKDEKILEYCCEKYPQCASLICPNDISYIQSEPIANAIFTNIRQKGYSALEGKQLYYLCKLMTLKEEEYKSFIENYEADEGHLNLKEFLKVYTERFYYLPKIHKIERNIEFAFDNGEKHIVKNWQKTFKMAFDVPSISDKSFRAAFTKLGKFYDLEDKNLQNFVNYKMNDINLRHKNELQEEESSHRK